MDLYIALALVLGVISLYILANEGFSIAFRLTGLAADKASFQAVSLFTNAGYTTGESEIITSNKTRRRLALACMISGHIFTAVIVGLIMNIFFSMQNSAEANSVSFVVLVVSASILVIFLFMKIPPIDRRIQNGIESIAIKLFKKHRENNIIVILDIYGKKAVAEIVLNKIPEFMRDVPLSEMGLTSKFEVNVLTIRRDARIVDVTKDTMFQEGDVVAVFGAMNKIRDLFAAPNVGLVDLEQAQATPNDIDLIDNYGSNAMAQVTIHRLPKFLKGQTMDKNGLKDRYHINVVMIKRGGKAMPVDRESVIKQGDTIMVFGALSMIKAVFLSEE